MKEIPDFVDREKEKRELKAVLRWRPNLVYFVYGPINSGKTALLMRVFEELPEEYRIFYINFRGRDVERIEDLMRVLFSVRRGILSDDTREFIKEILKEGARTLKRLKGIPVPEGIFDVLFRSSGKVEDIFAYLEEYFEEIREEKYQPVFVLDEMQTVKDVINATGRSVLSGLFNFLIGMTKEKHLCHCLCATSDCLFIEDVYSNARLEGRAEYILVNDLGKDEAFRVYEAFGFEDKPLIWDDIGGKFGDMIRLFERKKQGYSEREALERILEDQMSRLRWMLRLLEEGEKEGPPVEEVKEGLKMFKESEVVEDVKMKSKVLKFLIEENILFYNPVKGIVRPQSQLIHKAIIELCKCVDG